jgi:SulP family sulfate permease
MRTFRPAVFSAFENYRRADFFADLSAGVTVGIIALPLAIGFAIASGVTPQQGLWTGIVAGLAVALLGGSRFQIAGPTGAFVPVLFMIVAEHGYGGLALAAMMAGVMLIVVGLLKMGRLLKFFPYPVVAGFTSGIAVIIFCGQLNEFLGLGLKMPEHVPQQIGALATHMRGLNWYALATGVISLAVIYGWPRVTKRIPASIIAVIVTALVAYFAHWPIATIGSKFGGIPSGLPGFHFPATISLEAMRMLMGPAFTIAALGAIESLLSAMVADGMADTRHDPNQELIGQGIANILSPLVGGIAATGAIARTAANIRSIRWSSCSWRSWPRRSRLTSRSRP